MNARKRFLKSIKQLLDKYPIEKITIQMILDESDLSKATFYKYYKDKYDLASSFYYYAIKEEIGDYDLSFCENVERFLSFIKENYNCYYHFIKIEEKENFFYMFYLSSTENFIEIIKTKKKEDLSSKEKISLSLFVSGCAYLFQEWIINGMKDDPKELSDIMFECMPVMIKQYF